MNVENLIPFNRLPKEKQKEIAKLGGIASGKKRRYNALMKKRMIEIIRLDDEFSRLTEQEYSDFKKWQREQRKNRK